jgi:hypothetical protein
MQTMNVTGWKSLRGTVVLLTSLFLSLAAQACSCMPPEAGVPQAQQMASRQVGAADQVLRVKVVGAGSVGNLTTYKVRVLETIKAVAPPGVEATLTTGPDTCSLNLGVDEEWVLFIRKGKVAMCGGDALLANANAARFGGATGFDQAAWADMQYKTGARWLELVRAVTEAEPRNPDGSFREPPSYTPPKVVAPPSWLKGEAAGQYLQFGVFDPEHVVAQIDLVTAERCGKALQAMAANQEILQSGVVQTLRCSAASAANRLGFHGSLRNKTSGKKLVISAQSLEHCTSMTMLAGGVQASNVEVLSECSPK